MGGTSREGLPQTRGGGSALNGGQDAGIRDDSEHHGAEQHHDGIGKDDSQTKLGVSIERAITMGASQKKFSMWLSLQKGFWNNIYSRKMPLISPKNHAVLTRTHMDLLAHDLGTAKWVADSNIMVIDHESQEDALSHTHTKNQIHVGQARGKGDNTVLDHQVDPHQHSTRWNGGRNEVDIQEG